MEGFTARGHSAHILSGHCPKIPRSTLARFTFPAFLSDIWLLGRVYGLVLAPFRKFLDKNERQ